MEIKIPVQVATEGLVGDEFERRGSVVSVDGAGDVEIDVEDVSDFFTNYFEPRRIRIPSEGFLGRSRIGSQAPIAEEPAEASDAPPGYSPGFARMPARMSPPRAMSVPVY